jgi:dTDP-4-dehydrorhamnose reductase
VIGAGGQLGTAFVRQLGDRAVPLTRNDLDLSATGSIRPVLDGVAADAVVNCAAYTKVDQAEREEELATTINSDAVAMMADWASHNRRPFLTFSTDYVFAGDATKPYLESSPTSPINAYGRSKLAGEQHTVAAGGLVVRTSWVISGTHPNFVATMIRLAGERELSVVDDQRGCPTICHDLAVTSMQALESGAAGLLHLTNQGPTTWYGLACAAVGDAGLDPGVISPCSTEDYPTEARRPAYSVLGSERLEPLDLTPLPPWQESLPAVVAEIKTWI